MNCPNCQAVVPADSKFCKECGSNISSASHVSGVEQSIGGMPTGVHQGGRPVDSLLGRMDTWTGAGAGTAPGGGDLLPGQPLESRYQLDREIGKGGFAVVYLARDRKLDRSVAVKRLLKERLSSLRLVPTSFCRTS